MGKRSDFKRKPRDFYATPPEPVEPLVKFLGGSVRTFAEPCAGEGDLVRHLTAHKLRCVYQGDISRGRNALTRTSFGNCNAIITNPPHTREILHEMIVHFQSIAPTWLLIDLDWVANLQAVPYLPKCSDIVIIGRVKWFANSEYTGKENYGWYRFDASFRGSTKVHNQRAKK